MGIVMREPRRNRKLSKPGLLELLRLVIWLSGLMEACNIICVFMAGLVLWSLLDKVCDQIGWQIGCL